MLSRCIICKYFLLFCRLSFHYLDNGFQCIKVFKFDEVQFIYIFVVHGFGVIFSSPLLNPRP